MKNNYRGWKLNFSLGWYEARNYGDILTSPNRSGIERKIDSYENERKKLKQNYLEIQGKIDFNG